MLWYPEGKFSNPVKNSYDWLGNGLYFWENNYQRALDFATHPPGSKVIEQPAVLGAALDLRFCLDLLDTEFIRAVKESYDTLKISFEILHVALPVNKKGKHTNEFLLRDLDCAVIENVHRLGIRKNKVPFDSVRGIFIEGSELYEKSGFNEKSHIQICIRNPNCIKGFFVPRTEVEWPGNF